MAQALSGLAKFATDPRIMIAISGGVHAGIGGGFGVATQGHSDRIATTRDVCETRIRTSRQHPDSDSLPTQLMNRIADAEPLARTESQSKRLLHENRINRINQVSWLALIGMGGAQIADVTYSVTQATTPIMATSPIMNLSLINLVGGLSIVSSGLALVAAIYGYVMAVGQLTENKEKQAEINKALAEIRKMNGDGSFKTLEKNVLEQTLKRLRAEEALLLQQRNSNGLNIAAAIFSIAAMCLMLTGISGIGYGVFLYYALLGSSLLLPIISFVYTQLSMNNKKYIQKLEELRTTFPTLVQDSLRPDQTVECKERLLDLLYILLTPILENDPAIRELFYNEAQNNPELCIKTLLIKLAASKMTLIVDELACRRGTDRDAGRTA